MVAEQLSVVRRRIADAAGRARRDPRDITLVAVSKGHGLAAIEEAYAAGQRDFGENRAQELADKAPHLPTDIRWHFIGSLQSRKAKVVRPLTSFLHSMDRLSLVDAWSKSAPSPPPVYIQVNLAAEPQKHGVAPEEVSLLVGAAESANIDCIGLMVIPPLAETPEASRHWFVSLAALRDSLAPDHPDLRGLSMGMTDDFEVAIEEGATAVRVGRAIFGPRTGGGDA